MNPERWGDISPIHRAREMRGPVLGLYGGADEGIPPEQLEAFERGLSEAGVEYEIVTYPGAPHSFFDRRFEEHATRAPTPGGASWRSSSNPEPS